MSKLEKLKSDPLVYYIYQVDYSIFNIPNQPVKYLVVVDESSDEKSLLDEDGTLYEVITTKDWFQKVINSEIISWICSCLDKKFVIKEHVKLLGMRNDLYIRKNMEQMMQSYMEDIVNAEADEDDNALRYLVFTIMLYLNLSHQILDFGKIINFKENKEYWNKLCTVEGNNILDMFNSIAIPMFVRLKNRTTNLVKK